MSPGQLSAIEAERQRQVAAAEAAKQAAAQEAAEEARMQRSINMTLQAQVGSAWGGGRVAQGGLSGALGAAEAGKGLSWCPAC